MILKNYLFIKNISAQQCAKELGRTPASVYHWMSGRVKPQFETMVNIANWSNNQVTPDDWARDQSDQTNGM
jgi:transcriptional regulator with XRE-family HTH domain